MTIGGHNIRFLVDGVRCAALPANQLALSTLESCAARLLVGGFEPPTSLRAHWGGGVHCALFVCFCFFGWLSLTVTKGFFIFYFSIFD
jgi:hypothetical protein